MSMNKVLVRFALPAVMLAFAPAAFGAATGGETLTSTVTVRYQNAANQQMTDVTASVDVTVVPVYSLVWENPGSNQVVDTGTTLTAAQAMTVQLRNAGNTTHNTTLTDNSSQGTNISGSEALTYECDVDGSTFTDTCFTGAFEIFAFGIDEAQGVTGAGTGNATISLTADLTTEIAVGDTVRIGNNNYDVTAVNATNDTIAVDDSTNGLTTDISATDGIVHEIVNFRIYGDVGDLPTSGPVFQEDHRVAFEVDDPDGASYPTSPATGEFEIAVVGPGITITKYVRNQTDDTPTGTCTDTYTYTVTGYTYRNTNTGCTVDAVGGDVLEYVIRIANAPGKATSGCGTGEVNAGNCAGPANDVKTEDDFPNFTTLVESGGSGVAPGLDDGCDGIDVFVGDGTEMIGDSEAGAGVIEYVTGTGDILYYYVGTGADDGDSDGVGTGTGGTVGVSTGVCLIHRITVD